MSTKSSLHPIIYNVYIPVYGSKHTKHQIIISQSKSCVIFKIHHGELPRVYIII